MIKHIVLWKIKEEKKSEILNAKATLLSMENKVPEVKAIQVGIDFLHSNRSYDLVLEVLLDDETSLNRYQIDDYHVNVVKKLMNEIQEKVVTIDYYLE